MNDHKQRFRKDIKRRFEEDIEIANDLNPDNIALGEFPIIGGLKTKKINQLGEETLINHYSKKQKK